MTGVNGVGTCFMVGVNWGGEVQDARAFLRVPWVDWNAIAWGHHWVDLGRRGKLHGQTMTPLNKAQTMTMT